MLASQLAGAGRVDLTRFPAPVAAWLRTGLAVDQEARWPDAASMLAAWRETRELWERGEERSRWWRRLIGVPADGG